MTCCGDPYGADGNSVLVMQQGCCCPTFSPEIPDARLAALITPEEYRASILSINSKMTRTMGCAFGAFFGCLLFGWIIGGALISQYIPPSYTCLEPNGECFGTDTPFNDSCCRYWCCEDEMVEHAWGPEMDLFWEFESKGCMHIDSVRGKDTNCNCWEVKQGKQTTKYCFNTRMEGEYEPDPGREWPRTVGLVIAIPASITGVGLMIFCTCRQGSIVSGELDKYRAKGLGHNFVMGSKHRRAAIVFRLPMQMLPTAVAVGPPGQAVPYGAFSAPPGQAVPYGAPPGQAVPYGAPPGQAVPYGAPPGHAVPYGAPPGQAVPYGAPPPAYGAQPAAPYGAYQQPPGGGAPYGYAQPGAPEGQHVPYPQQAQPQYAAYQQPQGGSGPDPAMGYGSGVDGVSK